MNRVTTNETPRCLNRNHAVGAPRFTRLGAQLRGFGGLCPRSNGAQKGEPRISGGTTAVDGPTVSRVQRGAPPTAWFRLITNH